ncbi:MAG TPA: ChbG/HpnK family deacetylase [Candidatus Paceibacterota bacterium]|nr:ChbG/HpnK family deacetylase [Candidatus Paceibacterota bacterium]
MLIVNADDWGGWPTATDAALACYEKGRITSVSAMVFMNDSKRAADLSKQCGFNVGLHLNFTQEFTGDLSKYPFLHQYHRRIARFLRSSKYTLLVYHPFLRRQFRYLFEAQFEEFIRLYGKPPSHFDGHQHMHLCTNMLLDGILPEGAKVRRSFSFSPSEKGAVNRAYRRWVDRRLEARHRLSDCFYCLGDCLRRNHLEVVFQLALTANVELMTHPERKRECSFLLSNRFHVLLARISNTTYAPP